MLFMTHSEFPQLESSRSNDLSISSWGLHLSSYSLRMDLICDEFLFLKSLKRSYSNVSEWVPMVLSKFLQFANGFLRFLFKFLQFANKFLGFPFGVPAVFEKFL